VIHIFSKTTLSKGEMKMDNKVRDILDSVSLYEGLEHHFRLKFSEELESRLGNEHPIEYPFKGTKTQQNAF